MFLVLMFEDLQQTLGLMLTSGSVLIIFTKVNSGHL
jgi:hypothetical protein